MSMRVSLARWEVCRHAVVLFWRAILSMSEQMYQRRITTTPFPFKTLWRLPCAAARHPVLGAHAPYSFTSLFPSSILFRLQGISNLCHRWLGIGSIRFEDQAWFRILSKAFRAQCCGTATRTVEIFFKFASTLTSWIFVFPSSRIRFLGIQGISLR
ncbi:hypothetical protein BDP27DRAFT_1339428 [Rhodocollybia butyracea]|uniref:Uncharacterized protein n=1 Tax=Rhodocollybia butyracea TaxID=206335 RepID=A0A9P5PD76_9AGAR|nr:hypothetical protein BDP27DRAFT_1339428 [Rhodocollybia butyracea]